MPDPSPCNVRTRVFAKDAEAMQVLGGMIARQLSPGAVILLNGTLGAGKSCLARAIIRALMGTPDLEVTSPTYTLVNVYDGPDCAIWHADLYRLSDTEELREIGLEDAIGTGIVLIEWPDRLGMLPTDRIDIQIDVPKDAGRWLTATVHGALPPITIQPAEGLQ